MIVPPANIAGVLARCPWIVNGREGDRKSGGRLRGWFDDCGQDVVWDLVRGGDHDQEDRALDRRKALAILDWLADHARATTAGLAR